MSHLQFILERLIDDHNQEEDVREDGNPEQPSREQPSREQPSREQPSREQPSSRLASRELASRELASRELASREHELARMRLMENLEDMFDYVESQKSQQERAGRQIVPEFESRYR